MRKFFVFAALAASCVAATGVADDLPSKSIQVISSADGRKKVHLEQGDLLLVEIAEIAGNAEGMKVDLGKSGLKLLHSGIRRETNDDGQPAVGSAPIVMLFEASKVASGKLKVTLKQVFNKTAPFEIEIVVHEKPK